MNHVKELSSNWELNCKFISNNSFIYYILKKRNFL